MVITSLSLMNMSIVSSTHASPRDDASGTKADTTARRILDYLRQFIFQNNDITAFPEQVDQERTLDCDDFAFYAYTKFKEANIPAKVLLMRNPPEYENRMHAICLFKSGDSWRMLDYDGIRPDRAKDWRSLPTRFYGKAVQYIEVDVENYWLQGEPYHPVNNPDKWHLSE